MGIRRLVCGLAPLLLGFLLFAARGDAQVDASISGTVKDTDGAVLVGAQVTVKSLDTGTVRSVTTDGRGGFLVPSLPLGSQEVEVEKPGFKSALRTGINLDVGQELIVNFTLAVGQVSQQVTVSANAPLVNTTTAETSGFVGEREVKDLPLNGRSWDNLIALNPGAIDFVLKSPNTTTSSGNTFTVNGRRPSDNLVLLNGIEYTGASLQAVTPGGVSGGLLGIDAVREFNVLTDTYSAKYGKRAGAQILVVTQSGTNALHGSFYEFLRNSAMDARNFFDRGSGVPPLRRNQFGVSLGGPLEKNRLFLFGNFEGFRQVLAESSVAVVPDEQARQGLLPDASGVYRQVPNLAPAMLNYMPFWPVPNGPELTVNGLPSGTALAYGNPRQTINEEFGTARADYIPRDQDSFAIAYTIDNGTSLTPMGDPLFGSSLRLRSQVASIQETHLFSPRTLNTFRFGFSRAAFDFDSFSLLPYAPDLSFVSGEAPGGIVIGGSLTTTGAAALTPAGPNNAANVRTHRNLFTWSDDVQASRGPNQFAAGIWFQRVQNNDDTASTTLGLANFSDLQTFLQGEVSSFNVVPSRTELGWRTLLGAWYFEDTIRLRPNLSLQAGIRHEFTTGWNEAHGRAANYVTDAHGILLTTPRVGSSALTKNNAKWLFGPRIALAWDVFGNGKTAVRAGFGTYYSLLDSWKPDGIPPFNGTLSFSNVPLASIVPIAPGTPPNPSCGPGVPAPCITYEPSGVQPDLKTPTVQEWSLRTEQQLDKATVLRLGYVGSFGYHEFVSIDPNTVPAQICANPAGCQSGGIGAAKGRVAQGEQYIPVAASRPNPYLSAGFFWYSEGNSSYNALQVELVRRLSRGLQVRGNFTWAKNLDVNSAVQGAQARNQAQMVMDRDDLHRDWGPSALGVAAQSNISWTYELPLGRGERFFGQASGLTGKLADGWQFNGILTFLSGFAFSPQTGSNRSGDGDSRNPDRPSLNPDFHGSAILGKQTEWFNPNAFVLPTAGTWGNASRGSLLGPGLAEVDLSLFKTLALTERYNLEFRAECFNVPNRANFSTPNATVFSKGAISPSAGLITSTTTTSRQLQLGLKLIF